MSGKGRNLARACDRRCRARVGLLQPYRVTLFAPHGQSFWWLAVEPPLLVVFVGVVFVVVARRLVRDLLDSETLMRPPAEHVHWLFAAGVLLHRSLPARARDRGGPGL